MKVHHLFAAFMVVFALLANVISGENIAYQARLPISPQQRETVISSMNPKFVSATAQTV